MSLLRKNIMLLLLMQGSNYLIPLITFPYLTRVLSVSQFGVYAFILTLSQYFVLFTDFGFNLSASKRIAQANGDKSKIANIFWATLCAKLLIGICCSLVVIVIWLYNYESSSYQGIIYILLVILGSIFTPIWFFQGVEKISALTITNVFSKSLSIPLILLFVKAENDVSIAVFIQGVVALIAALISLILIYRSGYVKKTKINFSCVAEQIFDSLPLFISTIAISLYTISTPIILNLVSNSYEVGLYASADRLRSALIGIFLVVGNVLYPRVNKLFISNKTEMYMLLRKIFISGFLFSFLIISFVLIFSPQLVKLLFGSEFISASNVLDVMSIQFFSVLMSVSMANYLLLPFGYRKEYMLLPMITCVIHVFLCSLLAMKYGAIGGALSVSIVEVFTMLALLYITNKKGLLKGLYKRVDA